MKEFRWEKAAQFHFPFEAAALNFIVTFFREHIQCLKCLCFKRPGVYKIIPVMRAGFNFARHPLLGVLPPAWVLLFFFFCYLVVPQCNSPGGVEQNIMSCSLFCFAVFLLCSFLRERRLQLLDLYFICRKKTSSLKLVLLGQHLCWLNFCIF